MSNSQPTERGALDMGKRNEFLDAMRGFAILGVVSIHFGGSFATSANAWTPSFYLGLALNQFFCFAVPLFVFISGFLASPYRGARHVGIPKYYLERITTIGVPYLIASIAAFFLLGISHEVVDLPTLGQKLRWLMYRFFFFGVHPTFYFIPMIMMLYFLRPLLSWMAPALHRLMEKNKVIKMELPTVILLMLALLLVLHLGLGFLGNHGKIDFYTWCRANPLFWGVYFYFGLVLPRLSTVIPSNKMKGCVLFSILIIAAGYLADWSSLTNVAIVGESFDHSRADYTYVNPPIVILNLCVAFVMALLLLMGFNKKNALLAFVGQFSIHIYLWHLFVLYFLAWRHEKALEAVRLAPELIVGFVLFAAFFIALAAFGMRFFLSLPYRYALKISIEKLSHD